MTAGGSRTYLLELAGAGEVPVTVRERGEGQARAFLLLHGGAGPASVAGFGELLGERARVIMPTHPGFDGTPRPPAVRTIRDLAGLYAALLDRLDALAVTLVGNSIGGWVAAELALLGGPRVGAAVLVDAVGVEVPGHPVTDITDLAPEQLQALSFHDPARAPVPGGGGPTPDMIAANMAALGTYGGRSMTDPTLLARLGDLDLPVHVIWGAADGIVTAGYGRALAAAIPGARFTLLAEAGHLPQIEAPERLLEAIGG